MAAGSKISWYSDPRKWLRAILMLDDSSHHIALGAAIGMFIALTPTVGIQMLIVLAVAFLTKRWFQFNKVAALLMVYVSNPLTVVPIYWFNYKLGTIYFPGSVTREEFESIFEYHGMHEWWSSLVRLFVDVGVPLLVGSLVMAICCGLATYPIMLRVIRSLRRSERQALRALRAAKRKEKDARRAAAAVASSPATSDEAAGHKGAADAKPQAHLARPSLGVDQHSRV